MLSLAAQCRKRPCCVGEILRVEVTQTLLCFLRQRCEQLCVRLSQRHKRPCCVGELLRIEVAQVLLCFPRQRREQLRIRLAQRRKRPCCVGKHLWVEVAHEGLPGLALAACPWALGRAPSVPGGAGESGASAQRTEPMLHPVLYEWPIPASDHPNPAYFLLGFCRGRWLVWTTVFPGCPIESLPERIPPPQA